MSEKVEDMTGPSSASLVSREFEAGLEMLAKRSPEALRATLPMLKDQRKMDSMVIVMAMLATGFITFYVIGLLNVQELPLGVKIILTSFTLCIFSFLGPLLWINTGRRARTQEELVAVRMAIHLNEGKSEIMRRLAAATPKTSSAE